MDDFAKSIDKFLEFRNYKILNGKGNISKKKAIQKAEKEYDVFNRTQKIDSDFDKEIRKMLKSSKEQNHPKHL